MRLEKYDAIVTSNEDEELRGRLRVACAGLLGDEDVELPDWVLPKFDWGWFCIPDVGEIVEIEVASASDTDEIPGQSTIDGLDIYWTGKRHWTDEETDGENESRPLPEDFKTNYGKRRGFATPMGHIFYFDDTEGAQKIQMSWYDGEKYQFISLDETGSIVLSNKNGTYLYLDAENEAASLVDQNGNSIAMDGDGIKLIDKFGNIIELKDGVVQVISQGGITITGGSCSVATGSVDLADGATDYVVKGTSFKITYDAHTHPGPFGPTGPPVIPMPPTNLSTVVKTK